MSKVEAEDKLEAQAKGGDIKTGASAGGEALYPKMTEELRLLWAFVRKELLCAVCGAAVIVCLRLIPGFLLSHTAAAWVYYAVMFVLPHLIMRLMLRHRKRHPVNVMLLLLLLYVSTESLLAGLVSLNVDGTLFAERCIDDLWTHDILFLFGLHQIHLTDRVPPLQ